MAEVVGTRTTHGAPLGVGDEPDVAPVARRTSRRPHRDRVQPGTAELATAAR
jgi:hypothetical protein